jgi:hypothetical protein
MILKKTNYNLTSLMILTIIIVTGCGGGGGDAATSNDTTTTATKKTGTFIDGPVEGLFYKATTLSGFTGKDGTFEYIDGETVEFFLGEVSIGSATGNTTMTPNTLAATTDVDNQTVVNLIKFLQTADSDGDHTNGIQVKSSIKEKSNLGNTTVINFSQPVSSFESDSNVVKFVQDFQLTRLVDTETAKSNYKDALGTTTGGTTTGGTTTGGTTAKSGNIPSDFQGQWMYVHNGEKTFLGSSTQKSITVIDDNLIQDNDSTPKKYLIRAGVNDVTTKGKVNSDGSSVTKSFKALNGPLTTFQKSFSGIGGIDIILKNVIDSSVSIQATTQSAGDFSLKAPSGSYTLTATDTNNNKVTTNIVVKNKAIDLGEFTVVNKAVIAHNFKTVILNNEPQYFGTLDGQTERAYSKTLQITNIGSQTVSGVTFNLSMNNSTVRSFTFDSKILGLEPGASVSIPVSFSFKRPDVDTDIPLNVTIKDRFDNEWTDHTTLKLMSKNESIPISVQLSGATGHIITPGRTPIPLPATIPYKAGDEYEIVLSALTANNESVYSLGVGVAPGSTENFNEPNKFEPDDNILQANKIGLYETKTSFLFGGDIDYYKLGFTDKEKPFDPRLVGNISGIDAYGIIVSGNYAYITDGTLSGLQIVDITTPDSPKLVKSIKVREFDRNPTIGGIGISNDAKNIYFSDASVFHIVDVSTSVIVGSISSFSQKFSVKDNFVYGISNPAASDPSMYTMDVSVPSTPSIIGKLYLEEKGGSVQQISTDKSNVFISLTGKIIIIDISTPTSPTIISEINGFSHPTIHPEENHAYITTGTSLGTDGELRIFDISSPDSPTILSSLNGNNRGELFFSEGYVFAVGKVIHGNNDTNTFSYIDIFDVSNPVLPAVLKSVMITGFIRDIQTIGNYMYCATSTGLQIIRLK